MRHSLRLKSVLASYGFYMVGGFLSAVFVYTNNRVGAVLAVMIPTIIVGIYLSLIVHSVQPRKKRLPVRRASRVARPIRR
jgi:xanthine/uracil/vitamin C permease (AzgA family)